MVPSASAASWYTFQTARFDVLDGRSWRSSRLYPGILPGSVLLSITEKKSHDILCGWKGQGMLGVAMNSGTQTIPFQADCEILQSFSLQFHEESETSSHKQACPGAWRWCSTSHGHHPYDVLWWRLLHLCSFQPQVEPWFQLSRSQLSTRCPERLYIAQ